MSSVLMRFLAALMVALAMSACEKQETTATGEQIVKVGLVAPLTGPQAHLGKDNDNGARLALEEANAQGVSLGGKKVYFVLLSEDDQADPKTATIVAQKLVDQHVKAVLGHLNSGTSIPASKIYLDANIPQISPSATAVAYTAQGYKTAFRVMTNDAQQGRVLGQYAVRRLGAQKVAIIDDRTAYGQGLADEVAKAAAAAGASIVAREFTTHQSTDFLAILTSIKAKKPDVVFFGGMDPQAAPMVKQMKTLGLNAKFLGGDGVQSMDFIKLAGPDAAGVTASSPGLPLEKMPGGQVFKEKFNAKYGTIQIYAPYAYDAANVMLDAMKRAGSADPQKYLPELAKTNYNGVTGPISFDAKGDVKGGAITLYRVHNGRWQVLETISGEVSAGAKK